MLARHPARKIVEIEGLAASAAGFVAMSGDEIRMAENGIFMVHLSQGFTAGDRNAHAKNMDVLKIHDDSIASTYAARAGKIPQYFMALMEAETWMTAEEAKTHGLIDTIIPAKRVDACAGPDCEKRFHDVPAKAKMFFERKPTMLTNTKQSCGCDTTAKAARAKAKRKTSASAGRINNGISYAMLMNGAINELAGEERDRAAIIGELATAADISAEEVDAFFTDDGPCPTAENLDAFATVSGIPGADSQQTAAEEDGCTFEGEADQTEDAPPAEGETVANRIYQIERDSLACRLLELEAD